MNYKILLFDLDDTLLDFAANELDSLNKLFTVHGYTFSDDLYHLYHSVNKQLWTEYENGDRTLENVLNKRFSETMLKLNIEIDGALWESHYRELLSNGHQLMEGAYFLCKDLSLTHRLFVVTNGVTTTQIKRLKQSGLIDFFEKIFTSQEIGEPKPAKEFFDYVMSHIHNFDKKETLIIGDSLNTDIRGGLLAGIDTCWMNKKSQNLNDEIKSKYVIKNLDELRSIC